MTVTVICRVLCCILDQYLQPFLPHVCNKSIKKWLSAVKYICLTWVSICWHRKQLWDMPVILLIRSLFALPIVSILRPQVLLPLLPSCERSHSMGERCLFPRRCWFLPVSFLSSHRLAFVSRSSGHTSFSVIASERARHKRARARSRATISANKRATCAAQNLTSESKPVQLSQSAIIPTLFEIFKNYILQIYFKLYCPWNRGFYSSLTHISDEY